MHFHVSFSSSMADFFNKMCCQSHFLHQLHVYVLDLYMDDVLYPLPFRIGHFYGWFELI